MKLGLARVSTDGQDHSLQLDALKAAGCERIFTETISGTKAERPELRKLLDHARSGDVIVVYSLSRLARSVRHLIDLSEEFQRREIGLMSLTESIDTTTPAGRFVFTILGRSGRWRSNSCAAEPGLACWLHASEVASAGDRKPSTR